MTRPIMPDEGTPRSRPVVDARQLWAGGVATAVVAALIALVGVVICRWLFNIPLLAPSKEGAYGDAHTTDLVLVAAAAALIATGIAHLLLVSTPRPMTFFTWIVALATLVMVLYPFSTTAPWSQKAATALVDLVIGIAIGSLINGVAARAVRIRRVVPPPPGYRDPPPGYRDPPGYGDTEPYTRQQWPSGRASGRRRGPVN
ncbi:MAG TPA: DUF6069 family protein [Streptosporangiaceae bacterium]|nr:DUF6069 family protein [Streptosporangiaceae bacterium]